jgi:bifunctional ADP-heptose synthase (sugar kinase/adenylyltransferase)
MKKVLVIGDSCEDVFRYGTCDRISPEAPVPVMKPTRTIGNGGMAINVFENLKALGIDCDIVTNDIRPVKTRYVDEISNQMLLRVDEKDEIREILATEFDKVDFSQYGAVVISDYDKGFLSDVAIQLITEKHDLVFMDTKKKLDSWAIGVEYIKINYKEFKENYNWLLNHYIDGNLIVTMGKEGSVLNMRERFLMEKELEVHDLSGAGDTFLAALVADFIKNNDIRNAIRFANRCSAWVVSQKGVVVVDLNKIMKENS